MGRRRQSQARKKAKKMVPRGVAHIFATFNNTIVTITDPQGNTVSWASAGAAGFRGSRKSTPYAARMASQNALRTAVDSGMQEVDVVVKGPGPGREAAIRALSRGFGRTRDACRPRIAVTAAAVPATAP